MPDSAKGLTRSFKAFHQKDLNKIPQLQRLSQEYLDAVKAVSLVLPFRVNNYVIDELIDWDRVPNDPMFQLTFPQPGMLADKDLSRMLDLVRADAPRETLLKEARTIQMSMNPHPAGQMEMNVPVEDGEFLNGMQHKYRETVLFFPAQGQTCHAYCTYCFRWAQFVGIDDLKFANREAQALVSYLKKHPEVTDVLFTGGDPMIMRTKLLRRYIEPLLEADLPNLNHIRIGSKSLSYWPHRFTSDADADDLMALFDEVNKKGKHLALMAHFSHTRELETPAVAQAMRRITATGAVIRCQAPLIRHVNDNSDVWKGMWRRQLALGAIPYYMFVERDTGPKHYFKVPLVKAFDIFNDAYGHVSGLGRTVRGPSMSATPGKVLVDGICEVNGQKVMALKFIQARNPEWVNRIFFANYDENAAWLDDLVPAFGESEFFFESDLAEMKAEKIALAQRRESVVNSHLEQVVG